VSVSSGRHRLAVLPLHSQGSPAGALAAIKRLDRAGSLELVDSVLVERQADGAFRIEEFPAPATGRIEMPAWSWLLGETADGPHPRRGGEVRRSAFGESFVAELRDVVPTAGQWLMLVVGHLDIGAVVTELRDLPRARLVYGVLPDEVFDRLLDRTGVTAIRR
jgi:hypothetical protein